MPKKRSDKEHETTEETRRRILEAGHYLFVEFGFRSVSTRQVAQQASISQPTLYYHFSDKRELYTEITFGVLEKLKKELEYIVASGKSGKEKLIQVSRFLLRFTEQEMNVPSMLQDIEHELDETQQLRIKQAFFTSLIQPLVEILEETRTMTTGNTNAVPPASAGFPPVTLAFLFLSMITTLSEQSSEVEQTKEGATKHSFDKAEQLANFYLQGLIGTT